MTPLLWTDWPISWFLTAIEHPPAAAGNGAGRAMVLLAEPPAAGSTPGAGQLPGACLKLLMEGEA